METTNDINAQISSLAEGQKQLQDLVTKFAGTVVGFLSGQPSTSNPAASRQQVEGRRRGRPLGSKNKPKNGAQVTTVARAATPAHEVAAPKPIALPEVSAEKPLHPVAVEMLNRVMKEGRVRYTDLAKYTGVNRTLVHHHVKHLIEKGKVKVMVYSIDGRTNHVAYRPDWVLTHE